VPILYKRTGGHSNNKMKEEFSNNQKEQCVVWFRPLQKNDRTAIQKLHEEWFPVHYSKEFYDCVIQNKMTSGESLYTCVAVSTTPPPPPPHEHQLQIEIINDETDSINSEIIIDEENPLITKDEEDNEDTPWKQLVQSLSDEGKETILNDFHENYNNYYYELQTKQMIYSKEKYTEKEIVGCLIGTFTTVSNCKNTGLNELVLRKFPDKKKTSMFYIMTLGIVPSLRQYGLGSFLINQVLLPFLQTSVPTCGVVYLHVISYNQTAIRFYEALGFHYVNTIVNYYHIENQYYNCYLYAKILNDESEENTTLGQSYVLQVFHSIWNRIQNTRNYLFSFGSNTSADNTINL